MGNTAAKGAVIERKAIRILESEGYHIHRAVRTGTKRGNMWISQSNDVFNCIDLIAKRLGERTRWIQVTAHSGMGKKKDDLAQVPWDKDHDCVEIWRWVPSKRGAKHKRTGEPLPDQYFQLYLYDEDYELKDTNRIEWRLYK